MIAFSPPILCKKTLHDYFAICPKIGPVKGSLIRSLSVETNLEYHNSL